MIEWLKKESQEKYLGEFDISVDTEAYKVVFTNTGNTIYQPVDDIDDRNKDRFLEICHEYYLNENTIKRFREECPGIEEEFNKVMGIKENHS